MKHLHASTVRCTTIRIPCRLGIHARCAARIVSFTQGFVSDIRMRHGNVVTDAKSILGLMSLGARWKSEIEIEVEGPDAGRAAVAIETFFAQGAYCADHDKEERRTGSGESARSGEG